MVESNLLHKSILTAVRAKIFMAPPGADLVLHETELAKEFGISRTPIRKILQTLAHEKLVETRSGVGTVVPQLVAEHRQRDFEVYAHLGRAAAQVSGARITSETKMKVLGLSQLLNGEENPDLEFFVNLVAQSNEATCDIISDSILADALAAARWRVVRWRIEQFHSDPDAFWEMVTKNFASTAKAIQTGDPKHYLENVSNVVLKMRDVVAA